MIHEDCERVYNKAGRFSRQPRFTKAIAWITVLTIASYTAHNAYAFTQRNIPVKLGQTTINITIFKGKNNGPTYIVPHANEKTALRAAKTVIQIHGGNVIYLTHRGTRLVSFHYQVKTYTFDPNRIFTKKGIKATLQHYGPYSPQAASIVQMFSNHITGLLSKKFIIAVHNNKNSSVYSYAKNGKFSKAVSKININPKNSTHDFAYVTTTSLYQFMKERHYNVILQNNRHLVDDGSLSIYASLHHIPYINIEGKYNNLHQQLKMLTTVNHYLKKH